MFGPATQRNCAVGIDVKTLGKVFFGQFWIKIKGVGVAPEWVKERFKLFRNTVVIGSVFVVQFQAMCVLVDSLGVLFVGEEAIGLD